MANPTLTAEALRNLISEVVAEALAKRPDTSARSALPRADRERVDYDALAIKAFRKAGYGEVKPRIDTKTYNLWIADGVKVKSGEHATKVRNLRLFHRSQVEPVEGQSASKLPKVTPIIAEPLKVKPAKAMTKRTGKVVPISEGANPQT
jgi:hypothetical protein